MVQTPKHIWNRLIDRVGSAADVDSDIEEIVVKPTLGGVDAMVSPKYEYRSDSETVRFNGISLKMLIKNVVTSTIQPTSSNGYMEIKEAVVTEDNICAYVNLHTEILSIEPYYRLHRILEDDNRMTSSERLAYGCVDTFFYNSGSDVEPKGWELDGTLYKYDETDDIMHFHPMKNGLDHDDPYVQWVNEIKENVLDNFEINDDFASVDINMDEITFDSAETKANFVAKIQ